KKLLILLTMLVMLAGSVLIAGPASAAEGEAASESAALGAENAEAAAEAPPADDTAPPAVEEQAAPVEEEAATPPAEEPAAEEPATEVAPVEEPAEDTAGNAPPADDAAKNAADDAPAPKVSKIAPDEKPKAAKAAVKVQICHATGSTANPYVSNAPSANGVINGHSGHTGPVYANGDIDGWGDIIPPFTFDGVDYPGQNYTGNPAGQTIFASGCDVPGEVAVPLIPATAVEATATPPTCAADGALVLPSTEGVVYLQTPDGSGPGSYEITAEAALNYELTNPDFAQNIDVLPQLTGPQCEVNGLLPATAVPSDPTPATCTADGSLNLPNTPGVIYLTLPAGFNDFFVFAIAAPGYFLTNPAFFDFVDVPDELTTGCDTDEITICHRTNSNVNPYVVIGPDVAGVANGHDTEHEGPIWDPTLKAQGIEWGDIIPPYTYEGVDYPGQNWTAEGQAVFANGCVPAEGQSMAVVPEITLTDVCDGGQRPTPVEKAGVTYEYTVGDGITGPWEITATPLDGFDFADGVQFVFAGDAGDESVCLTPAVETTEICDGGDVPNPTEIEGIAYEYTVGDGITGPWEITASATDGFFLADGAQTVFTGDAGDASTCLAPAVVTSETCDGADSPDPTEIEGIAYEFTVGDGLSGPWEITASVLDGFFLADGAQTVFSGDAGDPEACVGPDDGTKGDNPDDGDVDDAFGVKSDDAAREDQLLPDTGGVPLWILLLAGPMTAAGLLILMNRRPVAHAFTSGGGPAYSLTLPPVKKVAPAPVAVVPVRGFVARVIAAVRSIFGGGQR
ncbi:MAG: hypothetical protein JWP31_774, partial [Aeromicrobium sp.]|nr:hypothetical protein [Aeromicrobium sp.]